MSMPPNNPFEPNPNSRFATQGSPPPKSNVWKWVLGILGIIGLLGAVVCCGGGYAMYRMGKGMIADQVKQELGANEVIQEHLGEIQSADLNFTATTEVGQEKPGSLVFDIVGTKGTGVLEIQQDSKNPGEGLSIRSAELVMPDGTRHEVIADLDSFEDQIDTGMEIDLSAPDATAPDATAPDAAAPDAAAPDAAEPETRLE